MPLNVKIQCKPSQLYELKAQQWASARGGGAEVWGWAPYPPFLFDLLLRTCFDSVVAMLRGAFGGGF